jgi:hypothetical protein
VLFVMSARKIHCAGEGELSQAIAIRRSIPVTIR